MPVRLQKGVKVEFDGAIWRITRQLPGTVWQLENERTGRVREMTHEELMAALVDQKLIFVTPQFNDTGTKRGSQQLAMPDEARAEIVRVRRAYVTAVLKSPGSRKHVKAVIKGVWEKLKAPQPCPDYATVARWRGRFEQHGGDAIGLVPIERSGNGILKLPEDLHRIIQETIDAVYLTRERKTVQDTLDAAIDRVARENDQRPPAEHLPKPTRRQVESAIWKLPIYDRTVARYGWNAAHARFRTAMGGKKIERPLQRAEIDHTKLDIFVIDDKTGIPLGRPWVTACIDVYTRCVLGLHMGFSPAGYGTVAKCLRHAVLPKVDLQRTVPELKGQWLAHGVMDTLVVDNGMEFHSKALEQACLMLNVEVEYCPRRVPWFKGTVERFLGSLNRGIAHGNPGTTFSKIFDKDDYDPLKHAIIRLSTLRKMLALWVVDYYHQRPHRILKASPNSVWTSSIKADDIPLPDNPARLSAILGTPAERKLTHRGIEYAGLQYNSQELRDYRYRVGDTVDKIDIRVDEDDLGEIIVLGSEDEMIRVPCLNQEYAKGLTAWQHEVCKRFAGKNNTREAGVPAWIKAKAAIAELVQNDIRFKGKQRKSNARIARWQESEERATADAVPAPAGKPSMPALPAPVAPVPSPMPVPSGRLKAIVKTSTPAPRAEESI